MNARSLLLLTCLSLISLPPAFAASTPPPASAPGVEKEEPLLGVLLTRAGGGYLNLRVEDNNWVIRFLDAEKKPVPADLSRGTIRYRKNLHTHQFILAKSADGKTLRAPQTVTRPYYFHLRVNLMKEGADDVAESYGFYYRQPVNADGTTTSLYVVPPPKAKKAAK